MKNLETDQNKIQQICNALRHQTLEPAKLEAERLINEARQQADEMLKQAKLQSQSMIVDAKRQIEQERKVFDSSLVQASKHCFEALSQKIEKSLFNEALDEHLTAEMIDPKVLANLINAIIGAIEKEGIVNDLDVIIPQIVSPEKVNVLLLSHILNKLKDHTVQIGPISGGIQVKLIEKKITLDMTKESLEDFLKVYLRKDFRDKLFSIKDLL